MRDWVRSRFEYLAAVLFVAAWLFILGLRALPLGGEWGPLDPVTTRFIVLWVLFAGIAIIAGGWLARRSFTRVSSSRADPNLPVMILSFVSLIGAGLIIIEFAFVRGYGFSTPVTAIRALEVNRGMAGASASLISGPGRLMMPAILPALLIVALEWRRLSKAAWLLFGLAAFAFLYEQIKFEGGRWFLFGTFFAAAFLLIGDLLKGDQQGQASFRHKVVNVVVLLGLYGAILFGYSISVFANRYLDTGEGQQAAYERFSSEIIQQRSAPNASIPNSLGKTPNTKLEKVLYHPTTKFFWLYATHGVNELNNLMFWGSFSHSLGAYQFPQLARISDRLLGTDLRVEYKDNFPNIGLYTTMIGANFVDFGFAGAIGFGVVLGAMLGFWANLFGRQSGSSFSSLAFPTMMTLLVLSPIISIVNHLWPVMCWSVVAYLIAALPFPSGRRLEPRGQQL